MNNFNFYNPTKIFFGKDAIENLSEQIKVYKNVLLVYGGNSIKQNGIYDKVITILKKDNKTVFELSKVMSNPRVNKVYEGIKICKENNIEFILAVGGGSVIDCSKAIAIGSNTKKDIWSFYSGTEELPTSSLPLGTILTISATGSEMNQYSVITNWETGDKICIGNPILYPKFSILDPTYTYTVPKDQTAYGSIDIIAHVLEQYFSFPNTSNLSDSIAESIVKLTIESLDIVLQNSEDYDARANLMWCSTMALNEIIGLGKEQDWCSHGIAEPLSGIYDINHGASLSIILPNWMMYIYKNNINKFKRYAINIWNVNPEGKSSDMIALEGIYKTKEYFMKVGAPVTLKEVNIFEKDLDSIVQKVNIVGTGSFKKLDVSDVKQILRLSL